MSLFSTVAYFSFRYLILKENQTSTYTHIYNLFYVASFVLFFELSCGKSRGPFSTHMLRTCEQLYSCKYSRMCSQCFSPLGTHHAPIVYRSELGGKNLKCLEIIRWLAFPWVPCHPEQAFWRAHYSLLPLVLIKENKNRSIIEYDVDFELRHCLKREC